MNLHLCLPQTYDDALKSRVEEMREFHRQLADISDDTKRERVQMEIQGHFFLWLQRTGKIRQLAYLARMDEATSEPAPEPVPRAKPA